MLHCFGFAHAQVCSLVFPCLSRSQDYDSAGRTTPNQIDHIDFTEDTAAVCAKVNAQSASGGGDGPEDICGCFRQAFRLDWQAKARFLILILDAPCHGSEFHSWGDR